MLSIMDVLKKFYIEVPENLVDEIKKNLPEGKTVEGWIEDKVKAFSEFVDIETASSILHQKVSTLYRKACKREIPSYKFQGTLLFKRSELIAIVEKSKRHSIEELQAEAVRHMEGRK